MVDLYRMQFYQYNMSAHPKGLKRARQGNPDMPTTLIASVTALVHASEQYTLAANANSRLAL